MKVLVATVMQYPHVGGASTHLAGLARELSSRAMLAGMVHGGRLSLSIGERLLSSALRLVSRDAARVRKTEAIRRNLTALVAEACDGWENGVIHCHDPLASCAALRARRRGVVVVQTVHGPWSKENQTGGTSRESDYGRLIAQFEREAFDGVDLLLPVDSGQAAILTDEHGVPRERICIVENAVDVDALARTPLPGPEASLPAEYFVVPRRLVPKNGVEFAVRAMALVNWPNAQLIVAGGGPLRGSLKSLAAELGVAGRVRFLGNVTQHDLFPLMKAARAVIVPSVPACGVVEATSLSVLEAMALGTPVIGSAIGGIAEILAEPGLGFLTPPADARRWPSRWTPCCGSTRRPGSGSLPPRWRGCETTLAAAAGSAASLPPTNKH